jgi:hypothetical protein
MPVSALATEPVQITVVESGLPLLRGHAPGARHAWHQLSARDPSGGRTQRDGAGADGPAPPMSPLILLDGAFFSSGRLPRPRLEKTLAARFGRAGTAARPRAGESHHG